jgi:hypothetical protein
VAVSEDGGSHHARRPIASTTAHGAMSSRYRAVVGELDGTPVIDLCNVNGAKAVVPMQRA